MKATQCLAYLSCQSAGVYLLSRENMRVTHSNTGHNKSVFVHEPPATDGKLLFPPHFKIIVYFVFKHKLYAVIVVREQASRPSDNLPCGNGNGTTAQHSRAYPTVNQRIFGNL
ncbi:hypothetical protein J6590_024329 [Homalodisca vitripennis]|nr:hypothetical protein J6590_024329 [Homalodisca vitripennis]